jgi:hypothetical protein
MTASQIIPAWTFLADLSDGDTLTLRGVAVTLSPATRLPLALALARNLGLRKGAVVTRALRSDGDMTRSALRTDPSKVKFKGE